MIHNSSNAMGAKPCHNCPHTVRDHAVEGGRIYCMHAECGCDRTLGPVLTALAKGFGAAMRAAGLGKD